MLATHLRRTLAVVSLLLLSVTSGCYSVTHMTASAPKDALKRVADAAASDYTVRWINKDSLSISDAWVMHSIGCIGYTRFCADLDYANGELTGDFYLKSNQLMSLFTPITIDTGPGFFGVALKSTMRKQMEQILAWAGVQKTGRKVQHGASRRR